MMALLMHQLQESDFLRRVTLIYVIAQPWFLLLSGGVHILENVLFSLRYISVVLFILLASQTLLGFVITS